MIKRNPELRVEMVKDIRELLVTGNDEDQRVARRMARGLLELKFDTGAELLAQLRESVPA